MTCPSSTRICLVSFVALSAKPVCHSSSSGSTTVGWASARIVAISLLTNATSTPASGLSGAANTGSEM
jgi:hypothetical protein